jgi:hypothetical protein
MLIRYAGFDPKENDFSKLPRKRFANKRKAEIDVEKALALRAKGLKWREIGVLLAFELRRRSPFTVEGVTNAIWAAKKNGLA